MGIVIFPFIKKQMGSKTCIYLIGSVFFANLVSCSPGKREKQETLYETHCAACHLAPDIQDLPKAIWAQYILPEMGARMGVRDSLYDPLTGFTYEEQYAIGKTGVFPYTPIITDSDWKLLQEYILELAPDSLPRARNAHQSTALKQFVPETITLDGIDRSLITFMRFDTSRKQLLTGDANGFYAAYKLGETKSVQRKKFKSALVDYTIKDTLAYATVVGKLDPSELILGSIAVVNRDKITYLPNALHRPVHTLIHDFNKDGVDELLVSEFGYFTGKLSLFHHKNDRFEKEIIWNQPGVIRTISEDMNGDGKEDIVALISQGDESIMIFYQEEGLRFRGEKVVRFSPVYGSSWFELVDYDGDGDKDIVTVNGDNADKSVVLKPYHGMRIYINGGNNDYTEKYFYPLNGATQVVAKDFDEDGDIDFGLIAAFPDYFEHPEFSFVYLENKNSENFYFEPNTFSEAQNGRWLLMDANDVDGDGDQDIVLSSFSYVFSPVPRALQELWDAKKAHIMVLKNSLK